MTSDFFNTVVDSLTTASVDARHVKKRVGEVTAVDTFAAKRVADGLEALILEVQTRDLEGIEEWPRSRGFDVLPEPLQKGPSGRTRLCLQLLSEKYRQAFRALCADVCEVIADAPSGSQAVQIFQGRLVHWQSFLQKHGVEGLTESERCGLFGELLVLRDLLLPDIHAESLLLAWRGCKKAHQDFQFSSCALEVKTTRATIPDRISISNIQQLDCEGLAHMFLTVVHVHENEATGETLPEIVNSLRAALPEAALKTFEDGLVEVKYSDVQRDLYGKSRYQVIGMMHYEVRDEFPRITRNQIVDGVKEVKYQISIDACERFRTDEGTLFQTIIDQGKKD